MSDVESAATSPPSSIAPHSEDEFTTALVRHAARKLGFEFAGATYRQPNEETDGGVSKRDPAMNRHLPEILRQIELRRKALGDSHESIAQLHQSAAKIFEMENNFAKAEHHYTAALDVLESRNGRVSEALLPLLSSLGNFYANRGSFFEARMMFARATEVCDACHVGRNVAGAKEPSQNTAAPAEGPSLRRALLAWSKHRNDEPVAEALVQSASSSLLGAANTKAPTVFDAEMQTSESDIWKATVFPMSLDISEEQRQRLREPTVHTADDLRKLIQYVREPNAKSAVATAAMAKAFGRPLESSIALNDSSHITSRSTDDIQRLLKQLREAKSAP